MDPASVVQLSAPVTVLRTPTQFNKCVINFALTDFLTLLYNIR
jgi:hypothetical protein